ncbi:hydroxyacylglutathione hydrolase (glyoxalase II) [Legionella birminghamensis]|uniref:Hydroxyacylglutathione hydrolase n=1 Tax=Legionella birminghamensis TaxID=28083 RepID=A0A378I9V9_9GAMM|nr:hydroxyacylglutathione hydrolase [Legionella birminghamensis]KTC67910.1 hydroxyacylglutathione hydrolase (glyoxalase II) [Legionella birminghamensis]STX31381.1 hydroxyacylglutathione hydrolase (glyoxalase II) [Legionella birminghamensis]
MKIIPVSAFSDNYVWTLVDEEQQSAICVDPGQAEPVLNYLKAHRLQLDGILLTHHHADHISGVPELADAFPSAWVYGPSDQRIPPPVHFVNGYDTIRWLGCYFEVIEIPGHTSSHICYFEPQLEALFCGDTLFSAGCGRVFDGSLETLFSSLKRLADLPDNTKVYCGHEYTLQNLRFASQVEPDNINIQLEIQKFQNPNYRCSLPSTIEKEKKINPFLRTTEPSVRQYAESRGGSTEPFSVFKQLREDKNNFS